MRLGRAWAGVLACALVALPGFAGCNCHGPDAPPPPPPPRAEASGVGLARVADRLDEPVGLAWAPGDPSRRMFIVEKTGRIRIHKDGRVLAAPFLDMADRVSGGSEQGLLGLAFHPRYQENGRFFINYTDLRGDTRVAELRASAGDPDRADPASLRELLHIPQPYSNHNGGHLLFGPDGRLYIGTGDGGKRDDPHGNSQNRASLLGKMLTLDVDAPAPRPEILQIGLRNPWRYSFDRETGDLYIADVGQDRWEEVHVVPAGKLAGHNFGWNQVEGDGHCLRDGGPCPQEGMTRPVLEYPHTEGCSITGGFVYRGKALPELRGLYFYADYCTTLLRSFRWQDGRVVDPRDWREILDPEGQLSRISSFGEDPDGELHVASQDGAVFKIVRR